MDLERVYSAFRRASFPRVLQNGRCIYADKEFVNLVSRERARVDRGGNGFSVVIFYLENREQHPDLFKMLIKVISRRIRVTDEIGRVDKKSVGVLLLDVSARDALRLASEIQEALHHTSLAIGYRIVNYPSGLFGNTGSGSELPGKRSEKVSPIHGAIDHALEDDRSKGRKKIRSNGMESVDTFFAHSLPLWKRSIDILGSGLGILLFLPFGILVAFMIKAVSPGPVFFKQERLGFMGRPFKLLKFRTMHVKADSGVHRDYVCDLINNGQPMIKMDSTDAQIIPFIGKVLRNSCIDEIPQLINVFLGEMSLVGPRPCIPYEFDQYLPWHRRRILSVPGLTGLWQVSGKNRTTFRAMIGFDIQYGRKMSLWLDLEILIRTIWVVFDQTFNQAFFKKGRDHGTTI